MASRDGTGIWPWTHRFAGLRLGLPPFWCAAPGADPQHTALRPAAAPNHPAWTLRVSNRRTEPPNRFTIGYSSRNTSKRP